MHSFFMLIYLKNNCVQIRLISSVFVIFSDKVDIKYVEDNDEPL